MTIYSIEPERATLHGTFSRDYPPVLTIESGDSVTFRTLDAGWGLEPPHTTGQARRIFEPRDPERDRGHALCGPVAIAGAEPGMTLEVQIDALRLGTWGGTYVGGAARRALNGRLGVLNEMRVLAWELDPDALVGRDQYGHAVALRPFMGVMGLAPDAPGIHPTSPPRICGGNIDCKELVVGSRLYLPVQVPGALFSVGDGHALQGDGEVSGTAIECPMERVDLTFRLHKDLRLKTPRAETAAGQITFGFHEDLNEATLLALEAMLELLEERYGVGRHEALALASLVVDLRVTQIVNGVSGVHAVLPPGAIQ
jgi:acetamidase/formamidase